MKLWRWRFGSWLGKRFGIARDKRDCGCMKYLVGGAFWCSSEHFLAGLDDL